MRDAGTEHFAVGEDLASCQMRDWSQIVVESKPSTVLPAVLIFDLHRAASLVDHQGQPDCF
jgi:hypothetical protein